LFPYTTLFRSDLQKKHRVTTVKELLELKQDLENKLQATDSQGEQIEVLKVKIEKLHQEIAKLADQLTKNRSKATKIVEKEVQEVLSRVGMPHAQLNVEINKLSDFKSRSEERRV